MPMAAFHSLWEAMAAIKRRINDAREADEAMHRSQPCEPNPDPFRGLFTKDDPSHVKE
jgi:hypothetical protein